MAAIRVTPTAFVRIFMIVPSPDVRVRGTLATHRVACTRVADARNVAGQFGRSVQIQPGQPAFAPLRSVGAVVAALRRAGARRTERADAQADERPSGL